jgi:chemotaxis protein histidine kinase CheA
VNVESQPGQGAAFTVRLPAASALPPGLAVANGPHLSPL